MSRDQDRGQINLPPKETYFRRTGVHRYTFEDGTLITGVSANSWSDFITSLAKTTDDDKVIISPELITYTDHPLNQVATHRGKIESRIAQIQTISRQKPRSYFIIGTPTFSEKGKPKNSAVVMNQGVIFQETHKRSWATQEESESFDFVPEERPLLIPETQTGLLICSDLSTAQFYIRDHTYPLDKFLALTGKSHLIGKQTQFFTPHSKSLVLMSCWSVGSMAMDATDEMYQIQLRNIAWEVMKYTSLQQIAVVDRLPSPSVAKAPYNALLEKQ